MVDGGNGKEHRERTELFVVCVGILFYFLFIFWFFFFFFNMVVRCLFFGFFFFLVLFIYYFFNIVLTWKFVEASKASVLYIYIDKVVYMLRIKAKMVKYHYLAKYIGIYHYFRNIYRCTTLLVLK